MDALTALRSRVSSGASHTPVSSRRTWEQYDGHPNVVPISTPRLLRKHEIRSQPCRHNSQDNDSFSRSIAQEFSARLFDIAVALFAIALFLPLILVVSSAIKLSSPGPVLFVQRRVGRGGRQFPCLKFRSMITNSQQALERILAECPDARAEWAADQKLRNDPRITRIGGLLRKTSLDELPQLFNILWGHMSVVGPRPIIAAEIDRYGARIKAYCSVRPGLTGLWQVSGRNEVSYKTRVRLDAIYSLRKSAFYDLKICLRTVPAVLGSRGCY